MTTYPPDHTPVIPNLVEKIQQAMAEAEAIETVRDLLRRRDRHQVCIKSIEVEQVSGLLMTASEWRFTLVAMQSSQTQPLPNYPPIVLSTPVDSNFTVNLKNINVVINGPVAPGPQNLIPVDHCSRAVRNLQSFSLIGRAFGPNDGFQGDLPLLAGRVSTGDPREYIAINQQPPVYQEGQTYSVSVGDGHNRYTATFCIRESQVRRSFISLSESGSQRAITTQEALDFARLVDAEVLEVNGNGVYVECYLDFRSLEQQWRQAESKSSKGRKKRKA